MSYKIAFFTPLRPQKTGIADWFEEMLPYLMNSFGMNYQIDFFVDDFTPISKYITDNFNIYPIEDFEDLYMDYDLYVYQIGNNMLHEKIYYMALKHPGIVVLHDFAIHHLIAGIYLEKKKDDIAYFKEVYNNHGECAKIVAYKRAVRGELGLWETDAVQYPMNRTVIKHAEGVIVFSDYSKDRLEQYKENVLIYKSFLHCGGNAKLCEKAEIDKSRAAVNIKLDAEEKLITVIGFIAKIKRPYSIIEAIDILRREGHKFRLVFVGKLQEDCNDLSRFIKNKGLDMVVSITGFVSPEDFDEYLKASDICISLRYPTMGETSSALMHILRYGKPTVVTDVGSFCEVPNDVVLKIRYDDNEVNDLVNKLRNILTNKEEYNKIQKNAVKYAKDYLEPQKIADGFVKFFEAAINFKKIKQKREYTEKKEAVLKQIIQNGKCRVDESFETYFCDLLHNN